MVKYKIIVEYDGTRYSGWQMQENAKTIQGIILTAAENIFKGQKIDFQGAGRTDAGVHAFAQAAHLEVQKYIDPAVLKLKLNDLLPYDINILHVSKADPSFHARHDAKSRSYVYQISTRRTAFGKQFVWWIKDNLDIGKMIKAAKLYEGLNDFYSFADKDKNDKSTKVLINNITIATSGDLIIIHIRGSHFLWKQVRRMVGVLVEVGRGNLQEKDISKFLKTKTNEPSKYTAPPAGLYLSNVSYKDEQTQEVITPLLNI